MTEAVFRGTDASGHLNLWLTDGTAAGTSELIAAGSYSGGLLYSTSPFINPDFTVLGANVLFDGRDASGHYNLWVTNGTSAGTRELPVAGASTGGLFATTLVVPDFTVLGSKALFSGYDVHDDINLWVTDGTAAGTSELTVAGAYSGGLFSGGDVSAQFTVLGDKALFLGKDTGLRKNLWVTDGTSAGTSELTVAGANSQGLFAAVDPDFTVLGTKALLDGEDASGHFSLWVTDGTSTGTGELAVAGADPNGLFYFNNQSNVSPNFTVFGGRVMFKGQDASGRQTLWVTDGTSVGTREITDAGGNPVLSPKLDFAVLGNKVLFPGLGVGREEIGQVNLWATDGTPAGTSELAVAGASSGGLFHSPGADNTYFDPQFTVLGTKALFEALDAGNRLGLWVTDGTSEGTSELNVAGANSHGLFYTGIVNFFPDFIVLGSKVLFNGLDAGGHPNLWVTDGTSAGTSEAAVAGAYSGGLSPSDITVLASSSPPPSSDLPWQSDGTSIFLQSDNGAAAIWTLSGTASVGGGSLPNPGSSWHAKAPGDFNGDGKPDILWQNDSGAVAVWLLTGSTVIDGGSLGNPGPSWQVASVGDFNGDGRSDILWQDSSGAVAIWELNGASIVGGGSLGNPGTSWHAVGSGDFNADGKSDILWQNDSGQVAIWEMNGTTVIGGGNVANPGVSWHALGAGDFNGDGRSDILLQNDSGQVAIWEMNGSSLIGGGNIANPGASWHAMGVGDYNSDGKSDILLQSSSGDVAIWEMNGTSIIGGGSIANPGPTWHI